MSPDEELLRDLYDHDVTCAEPGGEHGDWVDDTADVIYRALIAAGWTPPARQEA